MIGVLDYLEYTAKQFPDKTAIADSLCQYTFSQLRDLAKALSLNSLLSNRTDQAIGVFAKHDADTIVLFFL